jgi:hypothetical protein
MTERLFTYPVSPKQDLFCRSDSLVTGFCAGRGAGKSQVGALRVIERARDGQRWMAAAPTYTMIEDATYAAFEEVAKKLRVWIKGTRGTKPRSYSARRIAARPSSPFDRPITPSGSAARRYPGCGSTKPA